jgi:SAM-dependent methyltransferase
MNKSDNKFDIFFNSGQQWVENYFSTQFRRIDRDAKFISELNDIQRIVNIGAAPFLFEFLIREYRPNIEIFSVDLEPERFSEIVKNLEIQPIKLDIETCSEEDFTKICKNPDTIVLAEVFEHLRVDLLSTITLLYNVLAPGGRLYITTPNGLGLRQFIRFLGGRTGPKPVREWGKLRSIGHMGHVREYSLKEVKEVLQNSGFIIEESSIVEHWNPMFKGNFEYKLIRVLEKFLPWFRWNLQILAKKPDLH